MWKKLHQTNNKTRFQWTAGLTLVLLLGLAGVISNGPDNVEKKPFDPRIENLKSRTINPMDNDYSGYIPQDAIIYTEKGAFTPNDDAEGFKKLREKKK